MKSAGSSRSAPARSENGDDLYEIGPAVGLDRRFFNYEGKPWCRFGAGTIECINGDQCLNHNGGKDDDRED